MSVKELLEDARKKDKLRNYLRAFNEIDNQEKINRAFMREGVKDYFGPITSRMDVLNERGQSVGDAIERIERMTQNKLPPPKGEEEQGSFVPAEIGQEVAPQAEKVPPGEEVPAPEYKEYANEEDNKVYEILKLAASEETPIDKAERLYYEMRKLGIEKITINPGLGLGWAFGITDRGLQEVIAKSKKLGVAPSRISWKGKSKGKTKKAKPKKGSGRPTSSEQIIDMIKANGGSVEGGNTSTKGKNQIISGLNRLVETKKLSKSAAKKIYDSIV